MQEHRKGAMSRHFRSLAGAAVLAAWAACAAAQSPTLVLIPGTAAPVLGESFTLDLALLDRPAASPVGFFDIDIVFDPTVLRWDSLVLSDALGSIASGQAINASLPPSGTGGLVNLAVLSLLPALPVQPLNPVFGQLTFSAIGLGSAGVGFGFSALETLGGVPMAHMRQDAAVSVVPEPTIAWLLAAGLLALAARRWLSRQAPAKQGSAGTGS